MCCSTFYSSELNNCYEFKCSFSVVKKTFIKLCAFDWGPEPRAGQLRAKDGGDKEKKSPPIKGTTKESECLICVTSHVLLVMLKKCLFYKAIYHKQLFYSHVRYWIFCHYPPCRYFTTHVANDWYRYPYICIFFSPHLIADVIKSLL